MADWRDCTGAHLIASWDALALMASEPNPFLESWHLMPSLRAFDPNGRIALLSLEAEGALVGLMPIARTSSYYGYPLPHLSSWLHANAFLGSPLVASGFEETFWRAVLDWADASAGLRLFLHIAEIALEGPLYLALRNVLADQRRPATLVLRQERALLSSTLNAEAYWLQAVSAKKRKELRRQYNRLADEGELTVERLHGDERLDLWIAQFLSLEASGWKGRSASAMASSPQTRNLLAEALTGAARRGRLERLSLRLKGEPIAMLATFVTAPGAFAYKTAFDERYARYSPGVLLQHENLALLEREGIDWCDSCAAVDHPMIDHVWRERRAIGRVNIALGGPLRRALFAGIARAETGAPPGGLP